MSRSVRIHEFGGPEVLKIQDVTVPEPGAGEVRLRIRAFGLNRTEATLRSGRSAVKPPLPTQIGFEAAGEIEALGPEIEDFTIGDRVAVIPAYGAAVYGFYGEVSLAPARSLVAVPPTVAWEDAAATWAAFATAWAGLIDIGRLCAGQTVVISAASSSVGLAAIQIARKIGATPVALTRTAAKAEELRAHGAAHVIATAEQDLVAEVRRITDGKGASLIFDSVAGPDFGRCVEAAAPGSILIVFGMNGGAEARFPVMPLLGRNLTIRGLGLTSITTDGAKLKALKDFVVPGLAAGDFKPTIAKVFPFDEIVQAHRYLEAGRQIGKIVVRV
ncbi:MAG: zinc-dependent alcohol dehydrogenase family protein [Steroidobacteraceae bacterium]